MSYENIDQHIIVSLLRRQKYYSNFQELIKGTDYRWTVQSLINVFLTMHSVKSKSRKSKAARIIIPITRLPQIKVKNQTLQSRVKYTSGTLAATEKKLTNSSKSSKRCKYNLKPLAWKGRYICGIYIHIHNLQYKTK